MIAQGLSTLLPVPQSSQEIRRVYATLVMKKSEAALYWYWDAISRVFKSSQSTLVLITRLYSARYL